MDCARSARYLLAVVTIAVAISLGCAAPIFGVTLTSQRNTGDSAPTSRLSKLPLPLPKISVIFSTGKDQLPQTSPDDKQQEQPPQQQPQQSPPKPTVDEQPDGKDPYQSSPNASVTTSPRPKLETTTEERSVIQAPLFPCDEGQEFNEHRECVKKGVRIANPEGEED